MDLNKIADRTLVISLKRSERRDTLLANFAERGITNFELVDAVDGSELDLEDMRAHDEIATKRGDPFRVFAPGQVGCMLSHIKVMEYALAADWQTVCICEDDAHWLPEAGDVMGRAFEHLPNDWEAVYLHSYKGSWPKPRFRAELLERVGPGLYIERTSGGTMCILYRRRAVRALLEIVKVAPLTRHIDGFTNQLRKKYGFRTYTVFPFPVRYAGGPSEIELRGGTDRPGMRARRKKRWAEM